MDYSSVREESSSNTGSSNSSSLAARGKKTDFKDDGIGEVGVQFPPPIAVWKRNKTASLTVHLPEGPLLKMPQTDGGETSSRRDFSHRPWP